jgi:hypothetical protein
MHHGVWQRFAQLSANCTASTTQEQIAPSGFVAFGEIRRRNSFHQGGDCPRKPTLTKSFSLLKRARRTFEKGPFRFRKPVDDVVADAAELLEVVREIGT